MAARSVKLAAAQTRPVTMANVRPDSSLAGRLSAGLSTFQHEGIVPGRASRSDPIAAQRRIMKIPTLALALAIIPLLSPGFAFAQTGNMVNGGMNFGWTGGFWVPIPLVIVVRLAA